MEKWNSPPLRSNLSDASGKNLSPGGVRYVTIDEKTGKLVAFE